jgi:hypothetical protein
MDRGISAAELGIIHGEASEREKGTPLAEYFRRTTELLSGMREEMHFETSQEGFVTKFHGEAFVPGIGDAFAVVQSEGQKQEKYPLPEEGEKYDVTVGHMVWSVLNRGDQPPLLLTIARNQAYDTITVYETQDTTFDDLRRRFDTRQPHEEAPGIKPHEEAGREQIEIMNGRITSRGYIKKPEGGESYFPQVKSGERDATELTKAIDLAMATFAGSAQEGIVALSGSDNPHNPQNS